MPYAMRLDKRLYTEPSSFHGEYGVVQQITTIPAPDYNSNRRAAQASSLTKQLPGVSPLVYSRFLLDCATFLSLEDFGAELAEYEEIPVPLNMPSGVKVEYGDIEACYKKVMRTDRKIAKKVQSAFFNLLTAYPDQPYGHEPICHPLDGFELITPKDSASYDTLLPKQEKTLEIVRAKISVGEKVVIYTNWTRLDTQKRLKELLDAEEYRTAILRPNVTPSKREAWVEKQVAQGIDVLITNPRLVETGLDLLPFTTLIFYDMSFKLFTLRQASRRSWRINQTAPRIEVYLLYYMDSVQHKAIKLMASKLAVAGLIEGNFTEEGLAAMSETEDMTSVMAKELLLGIKDSVEDVAAAFKRMAILHPDKPEVVQEEAPATSANTESFESVKQKGITTTSYEHITTVRKIKVKPLLHGATTPPNRDKLR